MKTLYTISVTSKECNRESYECEREITTYETESDSRVAFEKKKSEYKALAERDHEDINITLWRHDSEDDYYDGDVIDDWFYDFVGEPTDGMVAMVKKPKYCYTPWQIISGDGKTQRYFGEAADDITVELIKREELTEDAMKKFGFPAWFIQDHDIDDEFC